MKFIRSENMKPITFSGGKEEKAPSTYIGKTFVDENVPFCRICSLVLL